MTLFLQRYNFTVVYRERFFLPFSRHPIQILMSRRSLQPIHAGQHPCVSRSSCSLGPHLTGPRRPSPALTDTICEQLCSATSSCSDMHLLQDYHLHGWPPAKKFLHHQLQVLWHFREELSIANGILLNSTRASSLPLSDQVCWAKSTNAMGEQKIAFVSLQMQFSGPTCLKT